MPTIHAKRPVLSPPRATDAELPPVDGFFAYSGVEAGVAEGLAISQVGIGLWRGHVFEAGGAVGTGSDGAAPAG